MIKIVEFKEEEKEDLGRLLQSYLAEMNNSGFIENPDSPKSYPYFNQYWKDPDRMPLKIVQVSQP